jgi:micrococcal nuclease
LAVKDDMPNPIDVVGYQDNYIRKGHCYAVHDGDTCTVTIDVGFTITVDVRLRLLLINTAELHAKEEAERDYAQVGYKELERLILNKDILIQTHKGDSFGRWLAMIYVKQDDGNWLNVNQHMLDGKFARPFVG